MPAIINFLQQTGFYMFGQDGNGKCLIMIAISFILMYLAIVKGFEPLLLLPISFGMLCTNLPGADMFHEILFAGGHVHWDLFGGTPVTASFIAEMSESGVSDAVLAPYFQQLLASAQEAFGADTIQQVASEVMAAAGGTISEFTAQAQAVAQAEQAAAVYGMELAGPTVNLGLLDVLYLGVKLGIYPCLIFMGVGSMTDFGPLIANPKSLLLGAAAQLGIFMTYVGTQLLGFTSQESSSIGIIGGADGPTAIFVTTRLAPHLLGPIAVAAYSYMALVPVIQPPIMKALTTKEERKIVMKPLRQVSKKEKIIFPIMITVFVALLVPSAAPLIACLMLGNLFKESGVVADEHRHHLPRLHRRRDGDGHHLPVPPDHRDHGNGRRGLRLRHCGRRSARQAHEPVPEGEDQPADRFRRRFRRPDGGACLPGRGPEGESRELPADARHGPERGRRHRLRDRRGRPHGALRLREQKKEKEGFALFFFCTLCFGKGYAIISPTFEIGGPFR